MLAFFPVGGAADGELRFEISVPGELHARLPEGDWIVYLASLERFWLKPSKIEIEPGRVFEGAFSLRPAGTVTGTLRPPRGETVEDLPGSLEVIFERSKPGPPLGRRAQALWGRQQCSSSGAIWSCHLPAGVLDLRLLAEGYSDVFFWESQVHAGKVRRLPPTRLSRGSSVFGWVVHPDSEPLEVKVTLSPATLITADIPGLGLRESVTATNSDGFFQFDGIQDGDYVIRANASLTASADRHIRVAGEAVLVDPAVVLYAPASLSLFFDPPLAPDERPWKVDLLPRGGALVKSIKGAEATLSGTYEVKLAPGPYLVVVKDAGDSQWAARSIVVDGGGENIADIQIEILPIHGRVLLGDEPMAGAAIEFENEPGESRVKLQANDAGEFLGAVAGEGRYVVKISADAGNVHSRQVELDGGPDGVAELEIRIFDTLLSGNVADRDGSPIQSARIDIGSRSNPGAATTTKARGSSFEVRGLEPGEYELTASARSAEGVTLQSVEPVLVVVPEESDISGIEVPVERAEILRGRVVSDSGQPIPGAKVWASSQGGYGTTALALSDADGRFESKVSRTDAGYFVTIEPPGHGLRILALPKTDSPLTLDATTSTGQLVLSVGDFDRWAWDADQVFLFHAGGSTALQFLTGWAESHGGTTTNPEWTIPAVQPGRWEACLIPASERWLPTLVPSMRRSHWLCEAGEVLPGSSLRLGVAKRSKG